MATPDMEVIKEIPGYKVILKAVLKSQIQQLVEQLATTTDEESVILTASVADGTLSHLGSDSGKNFLEDHEDIKSQFLGFCLKRHHKQKQEKAERERQEAMERERQEAMARSVPITPPRFGPRGPYMGPRSPRYMSPRQAGPHPISLSRASPSGGPRMRHEPYPLARPQRRGSLNFEQGRSPGPGPGGQNLMKLPNKLDGQVIKIEPEDDDAEKSNQSAPGALSSEGVQETSQPGSPSANPSTPAGNRTETSDKDEDVKSESSNSTIPNEASDTAPPGGLSLDSDLSNLISAASTVTSETTQDSNSGANTSELDPNVSVKLEAVGDSEMDLEITGVELGQPQGGHGLDAMGQQQDWSQGMMPGMAQGATGGPGDMAGQQGYNCPDPFFSLQSSFQEGNRNISSNGSTQSPGKQIRFQCRFCGKPHSSKWNLSLHERTHTGEKPFVCTYCGKGFSQKSNMTSHMITHFKDKLESNVQR